VFLLVAGFLAGGLSVVSLSVSFSAAFKETDAAGPPEPAGSGRSSARLPDMSGPASGGRGVERGSALSWTLGCLALAHHALGMAFLLLAAWWTYSSLSVVPHMTLGTVWTNITIALGMAAKTAGPLAGLGVWMILLGRRIWRGHHGVRRALTLTHGLCCCQES
jgi:hypothetical protein